MLKSFLKFILWTKNKPKAGKNIITPIISSI
jgi:hypothetical protein